jgi:hypothetical protein
VGFFAAWLNIRTQAMLALARPCEVLVMLEAAHDALATSNAPGRKDGRNTT